MKFLQSQPFTLRFFRLNLRSFLPPLLPAPWSGSVFILPPHHPRGAVRREERPEDRSEASNGGSEPQVK